MPALPAVPHVARLQLLFQNAVDMDIMVRQYVSFSPADTLDNAACTAYALAAAGAFNGNLAAYMHPDLKLHSVRATNLTDTVTGDAVVVEDTPGSAAGTPLPAGVALLVNFAVARRYRGGKPRNYWPLFTESDTDTPGQWKAASLAALAPHMTTYLTAIAGGNNYGGVVFNEQVNVSYYEGVELPITLPSGRVKQASKPRDTPLVDAITAHALNPMYGSQRRRTKASA